MKTTKLFLLVLCPFCMFLTCNNQKSDRIITTLRNKVVPLVTITSKKDIPDDPKVAALLKIIQNDSLLVETAIGIELRGALSQSFDKKSYSFECRNQENKGKKVSFLGMSADEDWVLHGPMNDRTLIRNPLAYILSNQIGKYAAKSQFVELEINGDYKGLYLLMEKLKRDSLRINIKKLKKEDISPEKITGGYILKIDKTAGSSDDWADYNESISFHSNYDEKGRLSQKSKINYLYEYPKAKNINDNQKAYIQNYVNEFEKIMAAKTFKDTAVGYVKYIDVQSFIDYFILTEFTQNHDGYRISTYLQKDENGKLGMGPIWDCDIAFGPGQAYCSEMENDAWVFKYNQYCGGDTWLAPFWWEKLVSDPIFKTKVVARWQSLRKSVLSDQNIEKSINEMAKYLQDNKLVNRNYERWSDSGGENAKERHQKHIDALKVWSKKHASWLDREMLKL